MNRNNNPGNLKGGGAWKGLVGHDERGHNVYDTPEHGFRALCRTWQAKWMAGKRTLRAMCAAWAPASDTVGSIAGNAANDPDAYAEFIAGRAGIGIDDPLPDPAGSDFFLQVSLWRSLARYEMGHECEMEIAVRGAAMWYQDFCGGAKPK